MAFKHGKSASLTFNSVVLQSFGNDGSLSLDIDTAETSVFGVNWKTFLTGQGTGTLTFSGHYDPAAAGPGPTLVARLFNDSTATIWQPGGSATGQTQYAFNSIITNYSESSTTSDRVTFSVSLQATGTVTITTL